MEKPIAEHTAGVQWIFEVLTQGEYAVLKSLEELDAVGHRMVHGGEKFNKSVLLTPEVMEAFAACNDLAPLHNPANIKGVNAVTALLPNIPQVGVFDTAFHQTMPDYAYMYALPYELSAPSAAGLRALIFAVTFLMDKLNLDTKGISNLLNKKSGLLGVSEGSSDFRDILAGIANGNDKARLAKEMYCYRIKKYIGEYAAAMGGVDIILFTGGAGENQYEVREGATKGLEFMGIKLDDAKNKACRAKEAILSADDSKVTICCIPTDEELMIALDTLELTK